MHLARVIGSVWATRKHAPLDSGRLVVLQPVDEMRHEDGEPLVALDTVGSGPGEIVSYVTAYEAVLPWKERHPAVLVAGVDASVVAIIDRIDVDVQRGGAW
jgi:ethanolamine utilization protein EutN